MDESADELEEIEFLARSANRIETLSALAEGAYTRRELGERVDASQPTLGRILRDLSERNWIAYDGERYAATATGELVAAGIVDLRERLSVESRLRPVVEYLPAGAVGVDLRQFADATVTTPTATHPNAPLDRMLELLRGTDAVRLLSHTFNRQKLELLGERCVEGSLSARGVFEESAIEALTADPELRGYLTDLEAAESADIRVADESVPLALELTDERVHLLLRDDDGLVRASVDTDDDDVAAWGADVFERFWSSARPLGPFL